ncbi:MAG TPA: STAS domain-containing protein [Bryobacteraceae bacterium]|jgi:anti-anti-sigma regulatory factor|nr:STAS domain-containing protein [Bryobacteraceae bacterium]
MRPAQASYFETELSGKTVIVHLKVRILDSTFPARERLRISDLLAKHDQAVLDFSGIEQISAEGLQMITDWIKRARPANEGLVLARCSQAIVSLFGVLRISRMIRIVPGLQEALASFSGSRQKAATAK